MVTVFSWEVGIWNEGVGGGGDNGVLISADVKNGFNTGWLGDTEEEFKEMLKWWIHGTWDWFSCWGWFGGWKCNSSHGGNIICLGTAVLKVWLKLILTVVLVLRKLAMAVGYLNPTFLEVWSKTYLKCS